MGIKHTSHFFLVLLSKNEYDVAIMMDYLSKSFKKPEYFTKAITYSHQSYRYLKCVLLCTNKNYSQFHPFCKQISRIKKKVYNKKNIECMLIPCYLNLEQVIACYTDFQAPYIPYKNYFLYTECVFTKGSLIRYTDTNPLFKNNTTQIFMQDLQRLLKI